MSVLSGSGRGPSLSPTQVGRRISFSFRWWCPSDLGGDAPTLGVGLACSARVRSCVGSHRFSTPESRPVARQKAGLVITRRLDHGYATTVHRPPGSPSNPATHQSRLSTLTQIYQTYVYLPVASSCGLSASGRGPDPWCAGSDPGCAVQGQHRSHHEDCRPARRRESPTSVGRHRKAGRSRRGGET